MFTQLKAFRQNTVTNVLSLAIALFATGCSDPILGRCRSPRLLLLLCIGLLPMACYGELSKACEEYCVERASCDREKGEPPPLDTWDTCESSCVEFHDDSFVDKANACKGLTSCDYTVCISE